MSRHAVRLQALDATKHVVSYPSESARRRHQEPYWVGVAGAGDVSITAPVGAARDRRQPGVQLRQQVLGASLEDRRIKLLGGEKVLNPVEVIHGGPSATPTWQRPSERPDKLRLRPPSDRVRRSDRGCAVCPGARLVAEHVKGVPRVPIRSTR